MPKVDGGYDTCRHFVDYRCCNFDESKCERNMICVAALESPVPYERELPWWAELDSERIIEEYREMRRKWDGTEVMTW